MSVSDLDQKEAEQKEINQKEVSQKAKNVLLGSQLEIVWQDYDEPLGEVESEEEGQSEFAELFAESCRQLDEIREGTIISGKVTSLSGDYVIVDIGHKTDGEIPGYEFRSRGDESAGLCVKEGDTIEVFLESFEDQDGHLVLSYEKAELMKAWDRLAQAFENEEVISGKVVRKIKGGLHVDVGVRAFLPGSQIDLRPVKDLDSLVGESFDFKIIKFHKARANVVLSRRVLLEHDREQIRQRTITNLKEGLQLKGVVKNLTDYGAFVDLGGVDGLLHITDMSWGRVSHPSQVFEIGQEIEVLVLSYDPKTVRVSLGYKQLQEDPWAQVVERYEVGSKAQGVVVSLTDYGAFVELEDGIEGLIHISEMSWSRRIRHPSKLVSIGDEVAVVILGIDLKAKRISLGMKQLEANPWETIQDKYQVGDVIKGVIRNVTEFGIFVAVEEGVDALIHVSDISWTERLKRPPETYRRGQEVEAKVLQIDTVGEKFSLGIKQLSADPWTEVVERYQVGSEHTGTVSKVMNFGAFVKVDEGFEGLIHVSELSSDAKYQRPYDLVKEGDEVRFMVLALDERDRKISLSKKVVDLGLEGEELGEYIEEAKNPASRRSYRQRSSDTRREEGVQNGEPATTEEQGGVAAAQLEGTAAAGTASADEVAATGDEEASSSAAASKEGLEPSATEPSAIEEPSATEEPSADAGGEEGAVSEAPSQLLEEDPEGDVVGESSSGAGGESEEDHAPSSAASVEGVDASASEALVEQQEVVEEPSATEPSATEPSAVEGPSAADNLQAEK